MPRRGDNIRKRKDGRWEARYVKSDSYDCAVRYGSVYGRTYTEAKQKREIVLRQKEAEKDSKRTLFRDILAAWQDANRVRLKEASVSRYQNLIDSHILPVLGDKSVDKLTGTVINKYLCDKLEYGRLDKKGGLSPSYVRSIALVISSAISYGSAEGLCKGLNSPLVKPPATKKELSILDENTQYFLERRLNDNVNEEQLLVFITLYTGLRIGEACALRWEDVSLEARAIYVRHTVSRVWYTDGERKRSKLFLEKPKTQSSLRTIPICSKLYSVLQEFPNRKAKGYILEHTSGDGFISPRTFEYRYKQILKSCGIEPFGYHVLRHTFATRCIERGVDIKSLSEILGHSSSAITLDIYVHSSFEQKRIQIEKLV